MGDHERAREVSGESIMAAKPHMGYADSQRASDAPTWWLVLVLGLVVLTATLGVLGVLLYKLVEVEAARGGLLTATAFVTLTLVIAFVVITFVLLTWARLVKADSRAITAESDHTPSETTVIPYDDQTRWLTVDRAGVLIICNFSPETQAIPIPPGDKEILISSSRDRLGIDIDVDKILLGGKTIAVLRPC